MINLTIDGHPVEVDAGATVLAAARALGVEIPTLCHHRAVPAAGACRVCVVEVKAGARPGLVPACAYPAQEGLEIDTSCERVHASRRMTLQLLLGRSPEAEVIRELAQKYGAGEMPFDGKDDKCILCGLSVRMCREVIGPAATCFAGRGANREVSTPYKMLSDVCIGCGACAVTCRSKSIEVQGFRDDQLYAEINAISR